MIPVDSYPACGHCQKPIDKGRIYMVAGKPMHWKCKARANAAIQATAEPVVMEIHAGDLALWHHDLSKSVHQPRRCRVLSVGDKSAIVRFFDKKQKTTREVRVRLTNLSAPTTVGDSPTDSLL